jgi:cytochrome c oxidase accessory protein FixG
VSASSPPAGGGESNGPITVDLYEKWRRIYPAWVSGGFQTWRRIDLVVLVLIYYMGPWLRWGGEPGVRFDLTHRQFTIFWTTFFPEDFVLLAWGLLIAALALFTITIAAGRIFCGWACPQTIWTLVYFTIERFIEGDRTERMRRDRGPRTLEWATKKALKYTAWAIVALSISITFVGYFAEIRELLPRIATLDLSRWERFFILAPAAGSFFFSAVLREQVCFHMCPYARFQSVMIDRDSLIISYDRDRGEPRGSRRRNADPAEVGLGSCIDCKKCVHVCPTGIDIRDGLQYQCIGCAACVDACGEIMQQMGYGESLVRYSSENRDEGKARHWLRPRLAGYSTLIVALLVLVSVFVASRIPLDVDVIRDRNRLYRESWDGSVENVYSLRISNREAEPRRYSIGLDGETPLELQGERSVEIAPGEMMLVPMSLRLPASASDTEVPDSVEFVVRAEHDPAIVVRTESPFHRPQHARAGADG